MTITPVGTTLPCKAWSSIEGFKPRHHVYEEIQMFPMRSESNLPSRTDNPQSNNNKQEGPSDSNYAHIKAQEKTRT
jgi:hypothetical protein